jgi:tRNA pseudouridine38-40 synthase
MRAARAPRRPMRNLKLTVAYVGTRYSGWQIQPQRPTVQGVLEDGLRRLLGGPVGLAGAGRTDAGVHARGQVASFRTVSRIPPAGLRRGLNDLLPEDIAVMEVEEVPDGFHARADARGKEYCYRVIRDEVASPFESPYAAHVRGPLDVEAMRAAAARLVGRHDFTSFCAADTEIEDRVRTLAAATIETDGARLVCRVRGDGFLRHMVRTLAGTLIEAGRGRLAPDSIPAILAARDRRRAGPCAPARGLTLERVFYTEGP